MEQAGASWIGTSAQIGRIIGKRAVQRVGPETHPIMEAPPVHVARSRFLTQRCARARVAPERTLRARAERSCLTDGAMETSLPKDTQMASTRSANKMMSGAASNQELECGCRCGGGWGARRVVWLFACVAIRLCGSVVEWFCSRMVVWLTPSTRVWVWVPLQRWGVCVG